MIDYSNVIFVTLEGLEAAGKTTQINLLTKKLSEYKDFHVIKTEEPYKNVIDESFVDHAGKNIFYDVFDRLNPYWDELDETTKTFLFLTDRAFHINHLKRKLEKFKPEDKIIILCDRFYDSSIALQGENDENKKYILELNNRLIEKTNFIHLTFFSYILFVC